MEKGDGMASTIKLESAGQFIQFDELQDFINSELTSIKRETVLKSLLNE